MLLHKTIHEVQTWLTKHHTYVTKVIFVFGCNKENKSFYMGYENEPEE